MVVVVVVVVEEVEEVRVLLVEVVEVLPMFNQAWYWLAVVIPSGQLKPKRRASSCWAMFDHGSAGVLTAAEP